MKPTNVHTRIRRAEAALQGPNAAMVYRTRLRDLGTVLGHLSALLCGEDPPEVDNTTRARLAVAAQDPPTSLLGRVHAAGANYLLRGGGDR
ncbi:hypothetical protein [Nocardiopsis nanhaiensis]